MGLFSSGKNPADRAMPYLEQIPGAVQPYYQPYIDQGRQAGEQAGSMYGRMAQDPMQYLQELMSGYNVSDGYKAKEQRLLDTAHNTAVAGGYAGLPYDERQRSEMVSALMSDDMQQWLNNVLGVQGMGLGGQQHLADQGFQASTGYGDIVGGSLNQRAGAMFQGQQQRNQDKAGLRSMLAQALGAGAGFGMQPSASAFGKTLW